MMTGWGGSYHCRSPAICHSVDFFLFFLDTKSCFVLFIDQVATPNCVSPWNFYISAPLDGSIGSEESSCQQIVCDPPQGSHFENKSPISDPPHASKHTIHSKVHSLLCTQQQQQQQQNRPKSLLTRYNVQICRV